MKLLSFPIKEIPKKKKLPAEHGLELTLQALVYQGGYIFAYNKLIQAAEKIRANMELEDIHTRRKR